MVEAQIVKDDNYGHYLYIEDTDTLEHKSLEIDSDEEVEAIKNACTCYLEGILDED